ncbi:MAG: response regulator transcription factor [Gemmatimonadales bacterium]|nr:response regulator transcription factor [Gemmatimonadales bacterium]
MIRVLVVNDGRLLRQCLAHVFMERAGLIVVGTSAHPASALAMVQDLEPDVVLVSMQMKGSEGLVGAVVGSCAKTRVVALGDCSEPAVSVLHDASLDDVISAVHGAAHRAVIKPELVASRQAPQAEASGLTPREEQIVRLIDEGLSNKEIARELTMAVSTVKNHVHSILEKLHVQRRGQAAALMRPKGMGRIGLRRQGAAIRDRTV